MRTSTHQPSQGVRERAPRDVGLGALPKKRTPLGGAGETTEQSKTTLGPVLGPPGVTRGTDFSWSVLAHFIGLGCQECQAHEGVVHSSSTHAMHKGGRFHDRATLRLWDPREPHV